MPARARSSIGADVRRLISRQVCAFFLASVFLAFCAMVADATPANTHLPTNVANLKTALLALRTTASRPSLKAKAATVVVSDQELPATAAQEFDRIQTFVFGTNSLIQLRACNGCMAYSDPASMSIYVDPGFLGKIRKSYSDQDADRIVSFILAHEISHFSYEYILTLSPSGLSPNGNIPIATKSFFDFVDLSHYARLNQDQRQAELDRYLAMASQAHAEVDLLAVLTLEMMGRSGVAGIAEKFQLGQIQALAPGDAARTDLENRRKTLLESHLD